MTLLAGVDADIIIRVEPRADWYVRSSDNVDPQLRRDIYDAIDAWLARTASDGMTTTYTWGVYQPTE